LRRGFHSGGRESQWRLDAKTASEARGELGGKWCQISKLPRETDSRETRKTAKAWGRHVALEKNEKRKNRARIIERSRHRKAEQLIAKDAEPTQDSESRNGRSGKQSLKIIRGGVISGR